jgi:hypothetical protein
MFSRIYVISRLKHLKQLDSSVVRESEQKHAAWIRENDQHFSTNTNSHNNNNNLQHNNTSTES